ncbi:hypothetical protein BKA70DRAFT_1290989 [Coprinopsis sp. MPI-PUGE-AT-0042]|nr:hypothetical protein BKA70DRAFT_1290989 [Coprinopsis sp. MPI-PUGE-AT-0042]
MVLSPQRCVSCPASVAFAQPTLAVRLVHEGAPTSIHWTYTLGYVQAVGCYLDQTKINVFEGDWGREMDPHGADLLGNPICGSYSPTPLEAPTRIVYQVALGLGRQPFLPQGLRSRWTPSRTHLRSYPLRLQDL